MTEKQWEKLLKTVKGESLELTPSFIIDCPWLPGWHGASMLDYFTSDDCLRAFPGSNFHGRVCVNPSIGWAIHPPED